ncbi:Protein DELAY OF GERMINATION 1 [Bienertia sinuspersici]
MLSSSNSTLNNNVVQAEALLKACDNLLVIQEQDHKELKALATESNDTEWTPPLMKLVERIISYYENFYRVESELIMDEVRVLLLLSPEWPSHQLDDAFLWVGGWRPSVTFHLLDFKPGSPLGAGLGELLKEMTMCDFMDFSPSQIVQVDELMRHTIREETELTRSLSESETEFDSAPPMNQVFVLGEIFGKAIDLRVRTLKNLVRILNPIQAVQFFIPAAQLHLKVREWSKNKEAAALGRVGGPEPFSEFFERRLHEQKRDLDELRLAATKPTQLKLESSKDRRRLVGRVMSHYKNYYRVKSKSVKLNVLHMLAATWMSPLEHAFLWIGGWRPTTAFQLLYSVVGLQLEARLSDLLSQRSSNRELADLSPSQLIRIDELQVQTVKEERILTEALATLQETLADSSMVELSHVTTELVRVGNTESLNEHYQRVKLKLGIKEEKLKEVFWKADNLRLRTLKNVVDILSPIQAIHLLIGAAELHLKLHEWGN